MRVRHWHDTMTIVDIIRRPDGSLSDGRVGCFECRTILDFVDGRWKPPLRWLS